MRERENPFLVEEYVEPPIPEVVEGRWMRHPELGDKFVPEGAYAPFYINGWRPIDEMERLGELQRLAAANASSDSPNGGAVEGTSTGDHVSERRDTHAEQPSLPGISPGLQDKGCTVGQAKIARRRKGSVGPTV